MVKFLEVIGYLSITGSIITLFGLEGNPDSNSVITTFGIFVGSYVISQVVLLILYSILMRESMKRNFTNNIIMFGEEIEDINSDSGVCFNTMFDSYQYLTNKIYSKIISFILISMVMIYGIHLIFSTVSTDLFFQTGKVYNLAIFVIMCLKLLTYCDFRIKGFYGATAQRLKNIPIFLFLLFATSGIVSYNMYKNNFEKKVIGVEEKIANLEVHYAKEYNKAKSLLEEKMTEDAKKLESFRYEIGQSKEILIKEVNRTVKRYPRAGTIAYSIKDLERVKNGSYVTMTSYPSNIHMKLRGSFDFSFKSSGQANRFRTGGIFHRYEDLYIATKAKGSGVQSILSDIDGDYWSTFTDSSGYVFIVKEALPGYLFSSQRFVAINKKLEDEISQYEKYNSSFNSFANSLIKLFSTTFSESDFIKMGDKSLSPPFSEMIMPVIEKNMEYMRVLKEIVGTRKTLDIKTLDNEVKTAIEKSFVLNPDVALDFKLQAESDMTSDRKAVYLLTGVKTVHKGNPKGKPIINVVYYKRKSSEDITSGYIYKVNKDK